MKKEGSVELHVPVSGARQTVFDSKQAVISFSNLCQIMTRARGSGGWRVTSSCVSPAPLV